jgi:ATP-dependent DNA helicase RecQ
MDNVNVMDRTRHLLQSVFGYSDFRPLQEDVIASVLSRKDTLLVMPTGAGKSLCYQVPALIFDGLTVVVSPLISLMKDQVDVLRDRGVSAQYYNSTLGKDDKAAVLAALGDGTVKLLYVAPEALQRKKLLEVLDTGGVSLLAVDEAHCISDWGHDFRRFYRRLLELRDRWPHAVCLACTATATPVVRDDVCGQLRLSEVFVGGFDRPNLFLEVEEKDSYGVFPGAAGALKIIEEFKNDSGIIYCFTRRKTESLSELLKQKGYSVDYYHAKLDAPSRARVQEAWMRGETKIIVATIAYGMGIDKPDIRYVIHADLPRDMESYYQQIGRAGRDGLPSKCLLLWSSGDLHSLSYMMMNKTHERRIEAMRLLRQLLDYVYYSQGCRRIPLLGYFGQDYRSAPCGMCDYCCVEGTVSHAML